MQHHALNCYLLVLLLTQVQNYPLLSAILTTIRTATVDACATEPEHTPNVYALAEMAHRLLNAKLKCMFIHSLFSFIYFELM